MIRCWTVYSPSFTVVSPDNDPYARLWSVPPYVMASFCILILGYSASRKNEHGYHLTASLGISTIGFILMAILVNANPIAMYASLIITCCGTFSAFPILLSWLTNNIGGHTKRALAIGFMTGFGKLGGILAPWVSPLPNILTILTDFNMIFFFDLSF